jgi:hypothetical protein
MIRLRGFSGIRVKSKPRIMSPGDLVNTMAEENSVKIWKIRTIKNYPDAHNHICIGRVLNIDDSYVRLKCRTYHFGKSVNNLKDIRIGNIGIRIIPWCRVEIVNELEPTFKYGQAELSLNNSKVVISDGKLDYMIASSYDSRY